MKQFTNKPTIPLTEMEQLSKMKPGYKTLRDTVNALPPALRNVLGTIQFPNNDGSLLVQSLQQGMLLGSCDGSVISKYNPYQRGHAYSLQDWNTDKNNIIGYSPTPMTNTMSSLTTELYGVLATALICSHNPS